MTADPEAIVIGGGFYGAAIASYLLGARGFRRVALLEREPALLQRASYHNQARIHNGYHYPRSFTTAYRSRINRPRFMRDWPDVVQQDFQALYAIARRQSKVTARQFVRFCRDIGARLEPAEPAQQQLFAERLIAAVFRVEEPVFDASRLAEHLRQTLQHQGVDLHLNSRADAIHRSGSGLSVTFQRDNQAVRLHSRYVFNCTYSGLNRLRGDFHGTQAALQQEIAEMLLLQVPAPLRELGITVMDGPFFSLLPFPPRQLHTLSHVRYTPHLSWPDQPAIDPEQRLRGTVHRSRGDRMLRDAGRYLPALLTAQPVESLFEVKTVLLNAADNDGRPIVFEKHTDLPGCYSVLGGKIDNIYDVLQKLDAEPWLTPTRYTAIRPQPAVPQPIHG